jgi:hypothetical protein
MRFMKAQGKGKNIKCCVKKFRPNATKQVDDIEDF